MLVPSPRIFGDKDKFISLKSKIPKRKKNAEKNSFFKSPLGILAVIIVIPALFLGSTYIINSRLVKERFLIGNIVVEGNEFVSEETILSSAGVRKGADLFKFDIYDAKFKVEKIPQILSASVRRKLPDTIVIQVVERSARAIVRAGANETSMCVDSEGVLLPFGASGGQDDMTVIYGVNVAELNPGKHCKDKNLEIALMIIRLHDNSILKEKVNVEKIIIDKYGVVLIHEREKAVLRRLYKVYLGKEEFEQRLANLGAIIQKELEREEKQDRKIDLTFERPLSAPLSAEGGS